MGRGNESLQGWVKDKDGVKGAEGMIKRGIYMERRMGGIRNEMTKHI